MVKYVCDFFSKFWNIGKGELMFKMLINFGIVLGRCLDMWL